MTEPRYKLIISGRAYLDIDAMLEWGAEQFGQSAVNRYEALLEQALTDLSDDPRRAGALARLDLGFDGLYSYHLQFSRSRTPKPRVKRPRHTIVYLLAPSSVTVLRILRDNRDLRRHLPPASDSE